MKAVVVDPQAPARLALGEVEAPSPWPNEAVIRVTCLSLNRGEVNFAQSKPAGARIGWDIAGVVERRAANGACPAVGQRVVAFLPAANGWAEEVSVPVNSLAPIPDSVSDADAAALPVAGLTALYGLERGQRLLGSRVLVTGATGGVGLFACQLARLMGAEVVAQVRRQEQKPWVEQAGAHTVVVDIDGRALADHGPYRLVFDGVGGLPLQHVLPTLQRGSTAVVYGVTGADGVSVPLGPLLGSGDASLQGFNLYHESAVEPASVGLERLLRLVATERLQTFAESRGTWRDVGSAAQDLLERKFTGKGTLTVD